MTHPIELIFCGGHLPVDDHHSCAGFKAEGVRGRAGEARGRCAGEGLGELMEGVGGQSGLFMFVNSNCLC